MDETVRHKLGTGQIMTKALPTASLLLWQGGSQAALGVGPARSLGVSWPNDGRSLLWRRRRPRGCAIILCVLLLSNNNNTTTCYCFKGRNC
jgi:hypothetical protein